MWEIQCDLLYCCYVLKKFGVSFDDDEIIAPKLVGDVKDNGHKLQNSVFVGVTLSYLVFMYVKTPSSETFRELVQPSCFYGVNRAVSMVCSILGQIRELKRQPQTPPHTHTRAHTHKGAHTRTHTHKNESSKWKLSENKITHPYEKNGGTCFWHGAEGRLWFQTAVLRRVIEASGVIKVQERYYCWNHFW